MMTASEQGSRLAFDAMYNLAVDCHEKGKVEDALELFRALSILDPKDMGVWRGMARCHADLGQEDMATFLLSIGEQIQEEIAS